MNNSTFSILITTKNRLLELQLTLEFLKPLLDKADVECTICDDGSTDGTSDFLQSQQPKIEILLEPESKGYLYHRNYMLNKTNKEFAISLDDDAHFLSDDVLETVTTYFEADSKCGLLAFRIYWGKQAPKVFSTIETSHQVNGFVGCGHVWRIQAWKDIPDYPEWFQFYGEEQFAALQLFKRGWNITYAPEILVQHRVDMTARKTDSDYLQRQRRSLRAGWYVYFLCYPVGVALRLFLSSVWSQLKRKTFKGNMQATQALALALWDVMVHMPKFFTNNYRLSKSQYKEFVNLPRVPIYWSPNE
ncbi:glycosyltransferase family 2 protein [Gaetbulibacter sp. PBL-D1]|uniref:glycosyltransferase family 2 protein n=1 Tax=Gaetbulibacter sp. PBL-D1 TaxID=3422594 RepID=UPI003D2EE4EA